MSEHLKLPESCPQEQAAYWFTVLRDEACPRATQRAFDLWLDESATHREAYAKVEYVWSATASLEKEPAMLGLRHDAIRKSVKPRARGWTWLGMAAAALIVGIAIVLTLQKTPVAPGAVPSAASLPADTVEHAAEQAAGRVIETAIGERSTFQLSDGSTVNLNTATKLLVTITPAMRQIILYEGQALFDVASDPTRPFVVFAGDRRITAIGTQFEVRLDREDVAVTLIEGKVEVADLSVSAGGQGASLPPAIELTAGQRVSGALVDPETVSEEDLSRALGWREGRLDFKNEALADVIHEINRYSIDKVRLANPSLGELRVSGSFKAGSVENFVSALTALYPLESATKAAADGSRDFVITSRGAGN